MTVMVTVTDNIERFTVIKMNFTEADKDASQARNYGFMLKFRLISQGFNRTKTFHQSIFAWRCFLKSIDGKTFGCKNPCKKSN